MAEYIDREAALDELSIAFHTDKACFIRDAIKRVAEMPAADVVEVVRCKDCEHCRWLFDKSPLCLAGSAWIPITENDFCAWGKRRADNG